ncbi:hypothetical protein QJS04_geneDACA017841 [Acorus gramineus]|uniref:Rapid ALkalinization Factor n=1 Tax=Acorus gramineus TaxID=55184 RepID=A0AAV9ALQ5_ACOGR|nr:hypothetical protein QJS04_geneDACA017841 [Acorus gramineus]
MKGKAVLFLSMLLLFIVVIQPAMAARVMIPTDAKPEGTSEIADAELDQQKESPSYRALRKDKPVCSTRPGGAYTNSCFKPTNKPPRFTPAPPGSP